VAYGTPSDPVSGTVITVAYAVANILDPIRWLRLLTGNTDPPGSSYVVVSDSVSGTTWKKIPGDALAAGAVASHLGYTPANRAGDTFTGIVGLPALSIVLKRDDAGNGGAIILQESGTQRRAVVENAGNTVRIYDVVSGPISFVLDLASGALSIASAIVTGAAGLKILLVLARESGGDYARYTRLYGSLVDVVQIGNEPDLASPSSWTMAQGDLAALGRAARMAFPRPMPLACAGLASGHPEWLAGVDLSWADAIAFHPYLKDAPNPTDIEDLPDVDGLVDGYAAYGLPLLITEWGWWDDREPRASEEVRDMVGWAARTGDIEAFFYFCASDGMVPPFGLLANGKEKPAAGAFREQAKVAIHSLWPAPAIPAPPAPDAADPWRFFTAEQIASVTRCPLDAIQEHWPRLVEQMALCGEDDRAAQVAMLGTVAIETASTFRPIHEYGTPADWAGYEGGAAYAGRGFIQLTHRGNYAAYGRKVDELWQAGGAIDLVARPDDALDPDVSAAVAAVYFRDHGGDGLKLIPQAAARGDWREVRRLVQGGNADLDRLIAIATALQANPAPPPPPPADDAAALALALRTLRDSTLPALRAQLDEAERIVEQFVGPRG
jgi:hypothetical protein